MKTVMKKMFSLLLVAVLLVSAVPVAFADTPTATCPTHNREGEFKETIAPTCSVKGKHVFYCRGVPGTDDTDNHDFEVEIDTIAHTPDRGTAKCEFPISCTVCGAIIEEATGHNWSDWTVTPATCTVDGSRTRTCSNNKCNIVTQTETLAAPGHNPADGVCTVCGYCSDCEGTNGSHTSDCDRNPYKEKTCSNCGRTYTEAVGHTCCERCKELHATADCPYCAVCWNKPENDKVKTHKTAEHCAECNTINGHASGCSDYTYPETGSHSLKVWARIWIHETEHKTILLDTIDNLSGNAKIYQVVAANIDRLESKFPAGYHYLHWYETVYRKNENNEYKAVNTELTVGDEDDIYVSLFSAEKLVVVNVHTSKGYGYDLSVRVEGFRVGDTVTYNDVLKAVKKYYNVSSMKIFTYEEMERYIAGKDANKTENIIVKNSDNTYEVFINGSRKSGTYTYTADSSNPKTGDNIFAPAIVMGASFTCLAVLFFLNKKRAY